MLVVEKQRQASYNGRFLPTLFSRLFLHALTRSLSEEIGSECIWVSWTTWSIWASSAWRFSSISEVLRYCPSQAFRIIASMPRWFVCMLGKINTPSLSTERLRFDSVLNLEKERANCKHISCLRQIWRRAIDWKRKIRDDQIWLTKGTSGTEITKNSRASIIEEYIVNPYISMSYSKLMKVAKSVGNIAIPSNSSGLCGYLTLRQRLISAEKYPLGLIGVDSLNDMRMWPLLKYSENKPFILQQARVKNGIWGIVVPVAVRGVAPGLFENATTLEDYLLINLVDLTGGSYAHYFQIRLK